MKYVFAMLAIVIMKLGLPILRKLHNILHSPNDSSSAESTKAQFMLSCVAVRVCVPFPDMFYL